MGKVDESSKIRPVEFDELFDLEKRLLEMKDMQIEEILDDVLIRDSRTSHDRKVIWLQMHHAAQKEHTGINKDRIAHTKELHGIAFHSISAVAGMFSALAGQTPVGGLMQLASMAAKNTGDYRKEYSQGTGLLHTHRYESLNHWKQQQMSQAQADEREHKQTAARVQQIADSKQQMWYSLVQFS